MNRIKKGDRVAVISGRDKGRQGTVIGVLADGRVLIENVNMVKKHQKPNPQKNLQGGIVQKEAPIHASNVLPLNPATKKGGRIGVRTLEDGRKVRFFKSNGEVLDA
jgi:large subunit ribosomal protein L24